MTKSSSGKKNNKNAITSTMINSSSGGPGAAFAAAAAAAAAAATKNMKNTNNRETSRQRGAQIMAAKKKAAESANVDMTMQAAMRQLPLELTSAYHEARLRVPQLVQKESNPHWFLSFHPNDPLAAATRLANYWKQRKEIFGQDRAFLSINLTGHGGLTHDDIRMLRTGFCINLPTDKDGRTVLYVDISKHGPEYTKPSSRIIFFFLQCVMENEISRKYGYHTLYNISNPFAANYSPSSAKYYRFLMDHCMTIPFQRVYFIHIPPPGATITQSFIDTIFTWGINRLVSYMGTSNMISLVASSKEDCLDKLVNEYHFLPEKLPVGLGGSWTGGCEPWRQRSSHNGNSSRCGGGDNNQEDDEGDESMTLEIETDVSCLFRNSLWLHNQVVAQQKQQQQEQLSAASSLSSSWQQQQQPPLSATTTTTTDVTVAVAATAVLNQDNDAAVSDNNNDDDTAVIVSPLADQKLPALEKKYKSCADVAPNSRQDEDDNEK